MSTPGLIPDGTGWVDAYGRPWVSHGDDMLLWAIPTVTLLGDDPQKIVQGSTWTDAGATAVDVQGTDITGSIVVDSSALDVNVPGEYPVLYTATDSEGYSDTATRRVIVLDVDRPEVRDIMYDMIQAGLPDGLYVYKTPVEQLKSPSVVIGTMSWTPGRMANLVDVDWDIDVQLIIQRGLPSYSTFTLETISKKVAQLLIAANFRVVAFTDEGMSTIGGIDYLTGSLNVTYKERST